MLIFYYFSHVDRQRLMEKRTRMKQLRAQVSSGMMPGGELNLLLNTEVHYIFSLHMHFNDWQAWI